LGVGFCVALAYNDPREMGVLARTAEESGFEAVILSDHLVYPETLETPYPYTRSGEPRWSVETPWPDPMVTVGALSAATSTLRFIVSIYVLSLRHPVLAAKSIATAAVLANDRLVLGVGAGWMREEFHAVGQAFARRGARTNESIAVLRKLMTGKPVAHDGEFYAFEALSMSPVPDHPVPIWGGGLSDAALRRAALHCDGWLSEVQSEADIAGIIGKLSSMRTTSERSDQPFSICAALSDVIDLDGYRRMADMGVTQLITVPWLFYGAGESLEQKCDGIRRFGDDIIARLDIRDDAVSAAGRLSET
jgi:probable F420-dependent oxidoreductase